MGIIVVLGDESRLTVMDAVKILWQTISTLYETSPHAEPKIVGLPANLLDHDTPEKMVETVEREFGGKLHILFDNAAYDEMRPIGKLMPNTSIDP
ncbi:uncharacterized protein K452DRAFT_319927 [Aplosporella prunicola CBS 121167]|uniref:Uncharacterized protein n=1 Tax=Aplosporella prunicola CBS 121167 TaxID=1176127 RepID=A0A6A6B997_9PEZI|nr:uncharacterized protein K452DRAFT_319927 [Aplosporella prunicola CBS 121167]KAF2139804.1 hypothetical protein K452DRAFT_319927 [Aplosporella prunicola CBS 121167]